VQEIAATIANVQRARMSLVGYKDHCMKKFCHWHEQAMAVAREGNEEASDALQKAGSLRKRGLSW
jgi:hypothetical protein